MQGSKRIYRTCLNNKTKELDLHIGRFESGKLSSVIDGQYLVKEIGKAHEYVDSGIAQMRQYPVIFNKMEHDTNLTPRIISIEDRMLVGLNRKMSLVNNETFKLWNSFMTSFTSRGLPPPKEKISLQEYPHGYFESFNPAAEFTKWALADVESCPLLPESFSQFNLPGGQYAVFNYVGSGADTGIFQYIYSKWIPKSDYILDNRPHFEVLGEKYKKNDPNSEEEIWIPIKTIKL